MHDKRAGTRAALRRSPLDVRPKAIGRHKLLSALLLALLLGLLSACGEAATPAADQLTAAPADTALPATATDVLPGTPATPFAPLGTATAKPAPVPTATAKSAAVPASTIPASVIATLSATPPAAPTDEPPQPFPTVSAGDFERTLQVDGKPRTYLVHVPPTDTQIDAMPFLLVLHGEGGSARAMLASTHWNTKSDKETFVVAYANGSATGPAWSAADLPFITQLLDDVLRRDLVDPERVYVTGFGGGGQMTYRLAQMLSDRISAIAPVDAQPGDQHAPSFPVALLAIHHKNDAQAPYAQDAQLVALWANTNGCAAAPKREALGSDAREVYAGCSPGANVVLYELNTGAHSWPAAIGTTPVVDLIWSFFAERTP
jgi:polyhydroxybutyrate depolymerase